jgi:hypothetical protein
MTRSMTSTSARRTAIVIVLGLIFVVGCHDSDQDDGAEGVDETVLPFPTVNKTLATVACGAERLAKLKAALTYATNRVVDGQYQFSECLNRSYLWGNNGQSGWQIGPAVAASPITRIGCVPDGADDAHAALTVFGDRLDVRNSFMDEDASVVRIAAVIVREVLHDRGFSLSQGAADRYDANRVSEQGEACIRAWRGAPAVDQGYVLWWDGVRAGNQPSCDRTSAVANCLWNKTTYPNKRVECYFNNARLGYELYLGGSSPASRVGFEPDFTRATAASNCDWNVKTYPRNWYDCRFDGAPIGYELYRDKVRVVQEPTSTKANAVSECDWNAKTYPREKVECYFDGRGVGFELLQDGKRVEFEPAWTRSQAAARCDWNKKTYPTKVVDCLFDGDVIATMEEPEANPRQGTKAAVAKQKRSGLLRTKTAR